MNINEFDKSIDEGMFLTKVDNIFIMLYTALMFQDLSRVDHNVSDQVMEQYQPIIDRYKSKNQRHMFAQLNVKSSKIDNVKYDEEGNIIVEVTLVGRYLDYVMDLSNGKTISGDDKDRVERTYKMVLKKSKDAKELTESRHCPNCGAHADLSKTGVCEACNMVFAMEDYDYVLQTIDMVG